MLQILWKTGFLLSMILRQGHLWRSAGDITLGCFCQPFIALIISDETKGDLDIFRPPFSRDVIALRKAMEELEASDEQHFKRKADLLKELEDIVASVLDTGEVPVV